MEKVIEFMSDLWDTFTVGPAPKLNIDYLVEGAANRGLKWKVTYRVNKIIKDFHSENHKFGKSGQPPSRVKRDDYREAPYSNMFLLYKSESHDDISLMEVYYIKRFKHFKKNDNISEVLGHKMVAYEGKYYLYLVV